MNEHFCEFPLSLAKCTTVTEKKTHKNKYTAVQLNFFSNPKTFPYPLNGQCKEHI